MSLHEDWLKLKALVEREGQEIDAAFHKLISEITKREDAKQAVIAQAVIEPVQDQGVQD